MRLSAILVPQDNETAALQTSPVGVFSDVNGFFCRNKLA